MPNTYTLLETITVGAAGASSVTFNSIPQTGYTDLVVKMSGRSSAANNSISMTFNGSSANFTSRYINGSGTAASSGSRTDFYQSSVVDESGYTANTFGNTEIYIPNYVSANYKSFSIDGVIENNATLAYTALIAGLWSNTAAITSITIAPGGGNFAQHSTFSLYGVSALGTTPTKAPKATGGSIIQTDGTYWYHAFLSSGTFTPATALSCDVLVVAGGGGGGGNVSNGNSAGAGGAGGYRSSTGLSISSASTVTIGAGGTGGVSGGVGSNGGDSIFSTITSTGGGKGGGSQTDNATAGGSGGGAGAYGASTIGAGNTPSTSPSQGNSGGTATTSGAYRGGGGGGATAVGENGSGTGNGGAGSNALSTWLSTTGLGVSGYVAGGGGGGAYNGTAGTGGSGGGGNGGYTSVATAGTANTCGGGGGGAGAAAAGTFTGGAGGSGLVIIRYLAA